MFLVCTKNQAQEDCGSRFAKVPLEEGMRVQHSGIHGGPGYFVGNLSLLEFNASARCAGKAMHNTFPGLEKLWVIHFDPALWPPEFIDGETVRFCLRSAGAKGAWKRAGALQLHTQEQRLLMGRFWCVNYLSKH
jgi:hypothetical protein